jgi:hypothetical protein
MRAKTILSRFKSQNDIITNLEKRVESQRDRANSFRDSLAKVELRLGYLECKKHSYKFSGLRRIGDLTLGGTVMIKGEQGYVFTCIHCLHEVEKLEKDLTPTQRRALHTLKILEGTDVSKKR